MQSVHERKGEEGVTVRRLAAPLAVILVVVFLAVIAVYLSRETRASTGSFAVYREATGLESITTTASDQAWDTTVSQASIYSIDAGRTTITLSEAGHYLAFYNIGVELVSGTGRIETQGSLNLSNANSAYGRSSCIILSSGGSAECWMSGAGIINATTSGDTLKAVAQRTDASASVARRMANTSALTLVRLNDSWAYARVREAGGGQTFNVSTWDTVSFDTEDELDTGYVRSDGDLTLAEAGRYLVTTNVHFVTTRTGRERLLSTRLTLNGYELPGTRVSGLMTGDNSDQDTVASFVGLIEATTTNQVLRLQGACIGEDCGQTSNAANGSAITVVRLPDTVDTIQLSEAAGGQQVDTTDDPITWDTEERVDAAAFSHSVGTNPSRVTVEEDGDYLMFATFYSDRTSPTSTVVVDPHWQWRANGAAKLQYGSVSSVNPGDSGTRRAERSAASGAAIFTSLSANDYIEVVNTNESAGGAAIDPYFAGQRMALQGISINTLEEPDIVVSAQGAQVATSSIPNADHYVGGSFTFSTPHSFPTETIQSVTITETGTVDAANDLSNIRLYYEFDTSGPYDCASETYGGSELQYGATSTSFSSANGTSTFTGSIVASSTQTVCMYVVLDVDSTATVGETIDVEITTPSSDVVLGGGPVGPNATVALTGSTTLQDDFLSQVHYHWRLDTGNEATSPSATGGAEDTVLDNLPKNNPRRVRIEVSNEGTAGSPAVQYRLEYAQRTGTCLTTTSGWTDVGAGGGAWDMFDSPNVTDGDDTTNIAEATGGVTDENLTFIVNNNAVKDTSSQTAAVAATSSEFIELEYSIEATASAVDGESYCFRVTDAGTPLADYQAMPEVSISADVLVSALGTHNTPVDASTTDFYIGGSWVMQDQSGSRNVTDVTLTEVGTVDAQNDLSNIRLYYELDSSNPYDCSGEQYDGNEEQYGATSTSFSAANGSSTFSEAVGISTTDALCLYAVLDVDSAASNTETIELQIETPGTQVAVSSGTVNPNTPVGPAGSTTIEKASLKQMHYHWRSDNGTEAGALSATGGAQDTAINNVKKTETRRLRIEVSNEGGTSTVPTVLSLEYAERSGSCSASSGWAAVGTPGGAWVMSDSIYLTNGSDTTNISTAIGGVTDENGTFLAPNGGVLDTQATTSALTATSGAFIELEYSIEATAQATFGSTYCFRLTGAGSQVASYDVYPQATLRQNQDFYIQRGVSTITGGNTDVSIVAGVDYVAPSATSSAFIRITNTMQTGAGRASGGGYQTANNAMAYISNPENITSGITFTRFGSADNTRVYWEIIEYTGPVGGDNEVVVRHVEANSVANKSLTASVAIGGVADDNDMAVFLTGQAHPDATDQYHEAIFTTSWSAGTDEAVMTRSDYAGGPGNPGYFSMAAVEFTGSNWAIQRAEHTYTAAGTTQTESIADVNDLSRAFIHAQHRTSNANTADFGHLVWLSAANAVSFQINASAGTPANHTSVAWIIENIQTNGSPMAVTRTNGSQAAGGTEASTFSISIGTTLSGLDNASIFTTLHTSGATTDHPRGIVGITIASTTHYELWVSDTGQARTYRTEVVEWPTAVLAVTQNYYRFYVDNDALDPTDPWPLGGIDLGENTAITGLDAPPSDGDRMRIRMSLNVTGANISQGSMQWKLQYGLRSTACSAISSWYDLGGTGSTTATWRGYNATPLDGTALSTNPPTAGDLNLSVSDRAGTYEETNPTSLNPYKIYIGDDVEFDWIVQANSVSDFASYCFRMTESDGTELAYSYYPTVTIAGFEVEQQDWRWYDDELSLTPSSPLAASNTAPSNIAQGNALKLRVLVDEQAGRDGANTKYKLQWSEYSNFSELYDVDDTDSCGPGSMWCFFDGAGAEGATITAKVLEGADACAGAAGDGCGTHNEYSYTPEAVGEVGTTTTDSAGTTVVLQNTYTDPVFIVEAISGDATGGSTNRPAAAVITATTTGSFTVRIQEPDDEPDTHGVETVAYLVMERGAYQLPDGRRVDVNSTTTSNYYGNAVAGASDGTCTFSQTFTAPPVLLASLQSDYNTGTPDFLTASQLLVTADDFACSIEVPDGVATAPSSPEVYGWVAIEGGTFDNNFITILATTTGSSITGWEDTPWYEVLFPYETFTAAPGVLASKRSRNGAEGGWARYDNEGADGAQFAMDERDNGNRAHTGESLSYLAFSAGGVLYRAGTSDFTFTAGTKREFEFTVTHYNARANATYFFRLYDVGRAQAVDATTTTSYPSLSTEGASLTFSITGIETGSTTEGVVTDITTTATSVPFGSLAVGVPKSAAQRLTISTNASEGYQVLAYERQDLTAQVGATIDDVTGTNFAPTSWSTGCNATATSCYGYHAGDNTLAGGSTRFLVNDTYAALDGSLAEIAYSSGPVTDESTDIVYRIKVGAGQSAGRYESSIVYIVVPVF